MAPTSSALQWLSMVGVIWLQATIGTNTNFPAYSSPLKDSLSLSQLQLNNLAFASDAGKLFGWLSGIASLYLPLWVVLFIGSFIGLIGYGVQYLFLTNIIHSLSYPLIFIFTILAGNSTCWLNTVGYIVTIRNFPLDQQVVVGLMSSFVGLSAKFYADMVGVVSSSNSPSQIAKTYLLLNSVTPLAVSFIVAPMVRNIDVGKGHTKKIGFIIMFFITIATGVYASVTSLGLISSLSSPVNNLIGLGIFLVAPLAIPVGESVLEFWNNREEKVHPEFTIEEAKVEIVEFHNVQGKEEIVMKDMLKRLNFWLYFFLYFFGPTIGLVFLNNLGQIAESRGCTNISSTVSLASSLGIFGRLLPSVLAYFFSTNAISNSAQIIFSTAPMAGAYFLLLNSSDVSLKISAAIIGFCTGAFTSISVSTTTELFGVKNFGVNHNIVVANIPIGSFLFGSLAAIVYRKEGKGEDKCIGMSCYRNTFIIWGSLCLLGTVLASILYARTRKFCSNNRRIEPLQIV
ncbi:hypothetical protein ACFE04_008462 [Oxalis oulophora]